MITEKELLDNIKDDPKKFGQVFHLYYQNIFGYIFRRSALFETAQDIAADTFHKAYLNIHKFDYRGISLKVWLYRIATNEINAYFRQKKRGYSFRIGWLEEDKAYASYIQQDRDALEQEMSRHTTYLAVLKLVKELPGKYQDVITLRYFEEKSIKEISQILAVKEGTVKSLLSRALEKLRTKSSLANPSDH